MAYPFGEIEKKWQKHWADHKTFRAQTPSPALYSVALAKEEGEGRGEGQAEVKPKYYALDMFPYPSGAGLHVGHPLWYMILLVYRQHNMQYKPGNILKKPRKITSHATASRWIRSVFRSTGIGKYVPPIRIITNGRSGYF